VTTESFIQALQGKHASTPPCLVTQENMAGEVTYVGIKGSGAGMTGVPLKVFARALNLSLVAYNPFSNAYELTCKGAGMEDEQECAN
jgi:hypothetical protein